MSDRKETPDLRGYLARLAEDLNGMDPEHGLSVADLASGESLAGTPIDLDGFPDEGIVVRFGATTKFVPPGSDETLAVGIADIVADEVMAETNRGWPERWIDGVFAGLVRPVVQEDRPGWTVGDDDGVFVPMGELGRLTSSQ